MNVLRLTDYTAAERDAAAQVALKRLGSDRIVQISLGAPRPYKVLCAQFTRALWERYVDLRQTQSQHAARLICQELMIEPDFSTLAAKLPMAYVRIMTMLRALAGADGIGARSKKPMVSMLLERADGVEGVSTDAPELGLTAEVVKDLLQKAAPQELFLVRLDYQVSIARGKDLVEVPYGFVMREADAQICVQATGDFERAANAGEGVVAAYRDLVSECVLWASPNLNGSTSWASHQDLWPALIEEAWAAFTTIGGAALAGTSKSVSL